MKNAPAFINKLKEDQSLRDEMSTILDSGDADALAAFALQNGASQEDIADLKAQHLWVEERVNVQMSDEELEHVSAAGFNWCNGIKNMVDSF